MPRGGGPAPAISGRTPPAWSWPRSSATTWRTRDLRAAAEREYEPRFFGEHQEQFGWFFNNKEGFPRGQGSAMLMAAEIAGPGDWSRAFEARHLDKYTAPDGRRHRVPVARRLAGVERPGDRARYTS